MARKKKSGNNTGRKQNDQPKEESKQPAPAQAAAAQS